MRHRFAVTNWLTAAYRVVQLVGRQAAGSAAPCPEGLHRRGGRIGTSDLSHIGQVMEVTARFAGAIVSFPGGDHPAQHLGTLGLVVLVGVPLLMLLVGPLLRPLQERSATQRHLMGGLANTASDIVGGLRCCAASAARRSSTTGTAVSPSRSGGRV